jgi:hypothetical integral membrane protein (TIGR02206 family)
MTSFIAFGALHNTVFFALLIGVILVILFRSNKYIKYVLAVALIAQVLIFNFKHLSQGTYDIQRYLPLHLCTISAILAPLALLSKNSIIKDLVIFWGLIPALLAIIFPDMGSNEGIYTFRFWEFFISHTFIVLSSVYLSIHSDCRYQLNKFETWQKITLSYFTLFLYALGFVYPLNYIMGGGTNYLYLMRKSSNGMGFLPDGMLYLPSLLILTFIVFVLEAVIYSLLNSFKSKK